MPTKLDLGGGGDATRYMTTLLCNGNRRMQGIQSASESEGEERNQNNMLMGKKE